MSIAIVILWVICAGLCGYIAQANGREPGLWAGIGLVTGVLGIIAVLIAGKPK